MLLDELASVNGIYNSCKDVFGHSKVFFFVYLSSFLRASRSNLCHDDIFQGVKDDCARNTDVGNGMTCQRIMLATPE